MGLVGLLATAWAGEQRLVLALTTALAAGVGAEAHARLHPRFGGRGGRWLDGFWIGPSLAVLGAGLVIGRAEGLLGPLVALGGTALLACLLAIQDRELREPDPTLNWLPLAFALGLYLVAFVLFTAVYGSGGPMPLLAFTNGLSAALLAAALFRQCHTDRGRALLYAAVTGLCVLELTLALGTWIVIGLLGGAFLLLFFYVAVGVIQAQLDGSLTSRMLVEYGCVGLIGLGLILLTSPWRP